LGAVLAACAPAPPSIAPLAPHRHEAPAGAARLRWIGTASLPPGTEFLGSTVGGISGIDYDPVHDQWVLLSDDRSAHQPARFYTARLHYRADALETPRLTGAVTLRQPGGDPFPSALQARRGGPAAGEVV
ncbi:esterase-like activity of phytase family protein, partial [Paracidovorax avenae]|uniref:esterase-like activity of phytase family protein n=1 Tax=Paracidovorax avenae TaxID=80867 RepID=UPI003EBEA2EC